MDERVELHLLVPREGGGEVLARLGDGRLPSVSFVAPSDRPIIGSVVPQLESALGLRLPVIETHLPWQGRPDGVPLAVLALTEQARPGWTPPDGFAWREIDGFRPVAPATIEDRLAALLAELRTGSAVPPLRPRWSRPGWFDRASAWMTARLDEVGRPPTGPIEQTHLRGISAVLRAPTAGGAAYLKAVFPPFHHEPVVTRLLADRVGPAVPDVLAIEADEGWLLMDDLGPDIVGRADDATLAAGIRTLVTIQRVFAGRAGELAAHGCPVRRLTDLPGELSRALDRAAGLETVEAPTIHPATIEWLEHAVGVVEQLGHPSTIVHGDFHPFNVVRHDGRLVIFDWSDAAVSHPLVDVATWLKWIDDPARQTAAWGACLAAWADACDPDRARPILDFVTGVGAAYQAISYVGILEALEPATRYTMLGGLTTFFGLLEEKVAAS
jgi:aminoglycoside phosphotransferase (APT) family kinase protein